MLKNIGEALIIIAVISWFGIVTVGSVHYLHFYKSITRNTMNYDRNTWKEEKINKQVKSMTFITVGKEYYD